MEKNFKKGVDKFNPMCYNKGTKEKEIKTMFEEITKMNDTELETFLNSYWDWSESEEDEE